MNVVFGQLDRAVRQGDGDTNSAIGQASSAFCNAITKAREHLGVTDPADDTGDERT